MRLQRIARKFGCWRRPAATVCWAIVLAAGAASCRADDSQPAAYFSTDVVPLLTRLGCNSGGCHGKATGQNGFKLSLLGFEPDVDHPAIVSEARGRRVSPAAAEQSLLILKATGAVPHGGGVRLRSDSPEALLLLRWIAAGAPPAAVDDPVVTRIEVEPRRGVLPRETGEERLRVTAHLSNGTLRDVTGQSVYQANEPDVAEVSDAGVVRAGNRSGLCAVMVRYGDQIAVYEGTVPFQQGAATAGATGTTAPGGKPPAGSMADPLLAAQWQRLGLEPSPPATDGEFIRRATLDVCGTLPTPDEVAAYVADADLNKAAALIDTLLGRPEYASYFALKWADILRNRGRGYSTSRQRAGTTLFSGWIRDAIAANMPYDRFVTEILTAAGSQEINPPAVWYRTVRTTSDYVESVSQAFLGVRIQCAQCHHHPAEHWSQDDYYGLAAVFARVGRKGGFADAEVPTNETIYLASTGDVIHPRTLRKVAPRPLGGPDFDLGLYDDPRRKLAEWMTAPGNPYFARTLVNRMWGHFLGRGIIHSIDDARSTNPPTNPELLDALARDFVSGGFDVRRLIRAIATSSAYRLSATPNESNRHDTQNFARFAVRRLPAEVLLDSISQVLDAPTKFSAGAGEFPPGSRAIDLPDEAVPSHFLDVFGRPDRNSACECERVQDPALGQTLELVSSPDIQQKLALETGFAARLAADARPHADRVQAMFWRLFARPATSAELTAACTFLEGETDQKEAYRTLLWSLLATNEFLFNH